VALTETDWKRECDDIITHIGAQMAEEIVYAAGENSIYTTRLQRVKGVRA